MNGTRPELSPEQLKAIGVAAQRARQTILAMGPALIEAHRAMIDAFKIRPVCRHQVQVQQCPFCAQSVRDV